MPPPRKLLIPLHRPGFEAIYQAASLAFTAGAMGDQVTVAPFFGGLQTLVGRVAYGEDPAAIRAQTLSLPDPRHMLGDGRKVAGVRMVACDTAIRLAGLELDAVRPYVDEIIGLASLWRQADGAQMLYI